MINHKYSVSIKAGNSEIDKELERIVLATGEFRLHNLEERPDLLIFELSEKFEEEFKLLDSLLSSNAVKEVFVTSEKQDTNLLRQAMRVGAKEFLAQPLSELEVKIALKAFKKRLQQPALNSPSPQGQIIHVIGAKGGVGTTTIAVNLAMILSAGGKAGSVALVDMNTVFGEVPLFLALKPAYHWGEIVNNVKRLDSTFLMNVLSRHSSGVHILPSPSYLNGHPPATPEIMQNLLTLMKKTFDYVIIDGGQSLDAPSLRVIEMSEHVLLITLLNLPCLSNTNKLTKSLSNVQVVPKDRIKIVINRFLKKSDLSIKEAEESVRSDNFWLIPNDYKTTMSAINQGKALNDISPKAPITKNLTGLADSLLGGVQGHRKKKEKGKRFFNK